MGYTYSTDNFKVGFDSQLQKLRNKHFFNDGNNDNDEIKNSYLLIHFENILKQVKWLIPVTATIFWIEKVSKLQSRLWRRLNFVSSIKDCSP